MSTAHPFLSFTTGNLSRAYLLQDWGTFALPWQRAILAQNDRLNAATTPPALASATALSQALGIAAATAVFGAAVAPVTVDVSLTHLAFVAGGHQLPQTVRFDAVTAAPGDVPTRLAAARAAFDVAVAPLVEGFPTLVRFGHHQREAMAHDAWTLALRDARGIVDGPDVVARESCCYLYLVPGTTLCAGCPRRA